MKMPCITSSRGGSKWAEETVRMSTAHGWVRLSSLGQKSPEYEASPSVLRNASTLVLTRAALPFLSPPQFSPYFPFRSMPIRSGGRGGGGGRGQPTDGSGSP